MIILVDNKNYAIRTCEESNTEHFIETEGGRFFGEMRLLSDIGFTIMVSGKEAEEYLDENNIYYIHMETIKKENFQRWTKRLNKLIEEEKDLIEMNNSSEKLIFAISADPEVKPTMNTANLFEVTRDLKTDEYFVRFVEEGMTTQDKIELLERAEKEMVNRFGSFGFGVEEGDFYNDVNFSSGKSILEVMCKLHMFIAVMKSSIGVVR